MKKIFLAVAFTLMTAINSFAQTTTVDVADLTLKVAGGSDEEMYYGFAEGDQIIFNFSVADNKDLKEVDIFEYPSNSKFMDYETKGIENKTLSVNHKSIYLFKFHNSSLAGRICKVKIQRVPASDLTKNFNTNIDWKTINDTARSIEYQNFLLSSDTTLTTITDQVAKVHSQTNSEGDKTVLDFTLPENTVAWSFWIGVGEEGKQAYNQANQKFLGSASSSIATLAGLGPLGALALTGLSFFATNNSGGENIIYYFVPTNNDALLFKAGQAFMQFHQGNVVSDYGRMTNNLLGKKYLCLRNDNTVTGIDVTVKIVAVVVVQKWEKRPVEKLNITAKKIPVFQN